MHHLSKHAHANVYEYNAALWGLVVNKTIIIYCRRRALNKVFLSGWITACGMTDNALVSFDYRLTLWRGCVNRNGMLSATILGDSTWGCGYIICVQDRNTNIKWRTNFEQPVCLGMKLVICCAQILFGPIPGIELIDELHGDLRMTCLGPCATYKS